MVDDTHLVLRALKGERDKYGELVEKYQTPAWISFILCAELSGCAGYRAGCFDCVGTGSWPACVSPIDLTLDPPNYHQYL